MNDIHLNGHHRSTLAGIFAHPESHNLEWHDVLALLNHVGNLSERHSGEYMVTIGDEQCALGRPHGKDLAGDELRHLRTFLTQAGMAPGKPAPETEPQGPQPCIVVVDHHEAKLYRLEEHASDRNAPVVVRPKDPDGWLRRVEHREGNEGHDGGHSEEEDGYYERISALLNATQPIVLLSDGKGRSSAGDYLAGYLKRHHPAISDRIVATDRVDISHLTDGEVVAAGLALLA